MNDSNGFRAHIGSYVDPVGGLYERTGTLVRGIHPAFASFYADLLENSLVREMIGRQIVETEIAADGLAGYALTLQHRRIAPLSFCYEWSLPMLREAAWLTLDICERLSTANLVLKDASPWNIVFEGTRPVFVDFTSLVPEDPHLLWVGYDQFCRLFLYPLVLSAVRLGRVARVLLMDSINGISVDEFLSLLPRRAVFRWPWLMQQVYLPRYVLAIIRRVSSDQALGRVSAQLVPRPEARRAFFRALGKIVRSIPIPISQSRWAGYYADISNFSKPTNWNRKQAAVAQILAQYSPKTVIDIGCNVGGYSILAARAGARVTAFDVDEASVSLLYRLAHDDKLDILPLIMDVLNPSPACGWRAVQFPSAPTRLRAEMALALALTHHLVISQRQTFERITLALADYAERWLLTEFAPLTDPRCQELLTVQRRD